MKKINAIPPDQKAGKVSLEPDEMEALRLVDYLGLSQEEAAAKMGVSQSTISRLLERARQKISSSLFEGREVKVEQPKKDFVSIQRVAFGVERPSLDSRVYPYFARSPYFVITDGKTLESLSGIGGGGMWRVLHYLLAHDISAVVFPQQPGPGVISFLSQNGIRSYVFNGVVRDFFAEERAPLNNPPDWWPMPRWGRMHRRWWW